MSKISIRHDMPVTLFPHSCPSEKALGDILSFFGPMTVYQPWYMEPPPLAAQKDFKDVIKVINPPPSSKPGEGFMSLLSEYKTWISQHRDKSKAAFLKASQEMGPPEESSWEIRRALRQEVTTFVGDSSRGSIQTDRQKQEEPPFLKWHIILHLAREIEDDRREADDLLGELKDKGSPLKGLLGDEDVKNPFMDLNPFESDPLTTLYPIDLIIEAWFALFHGYLKEDELLLTLSRHTMDYVSKTWETALKEIGSDVSPENEKGLQGKMSIEPYDFPYKYFSPISDQQFLEEGKLLKYLSGKTLILMD